jgi:hypothetical protein
MEPKNETNKIPQQATWISFAWKEFYTCILVISNVNIELAHLQSGNKDIEGCALKFLKKPKSGS